MQASNRVFKFGRLAVMSLLFITTSCKKEVVIDEPGDAVPRKLDLKAPSNFPIVVDDVDNPLTIEGVELGRLLFYDNRLSGSNRLSCASCHRQEIAFSDGVALSQIGESARTLTRHAPALINLAWANNGLFWDGGSTNLESQAFAPLASEDEMHQNLDQLKVELKAIPEYVKKFKLAFNGEITPALVVKALAQFQRTLISANAKYDQYIRKENATTLNQQELRGLILVDSKCQGCHSGALFTDNNYHNNGIDEDFSNTALDGLYQGRYRISYNPSDLGKYKTPTLRNIALTAPYMHDGRFNTLSEVMDHYQHGIKVSTTTDILLFQKNGSVGIALTDEDKKDIIAFLHTLTDDQFIHNNNFSKPILP
ncbi:MAG: c-type cytochrome [Pedobacter sp.]|nr:MAG: c-type cytochrome [Pedobacter sp.]